MKPLGIVAALGAEARTLGPAPRRRGAPAMLADGSLVAISGIGFDAAARAARMLADAGAGALLSWGVAGGLDPDLGPGSIVIPDEVISGDGARYPTARAWCERQRAAFATRRRVSGGALLSLKQAIDTVEGKMRAHRTTGAVAVDMESLAVAAVARDRQMPFLAVRAIVDAAGDTLPRAVVEASRGGTLRLLTLAAGIARAPAELGSLIGLARRYRAARASLAAIALAGLSAPLA